MMYRIIQSTSSDSYQAYLSGGENYRKVIDPQYKANRKATVDPIYREEAKAHLVLEWGATITDQIEADDALAIEQSQSEMYTTTICSIDKDLKQVPGYHYNWRKDEHDSVTPMDGLRAFYKQLLTGDRSDNILVPFRIGPVKANQLLGGITDEMDMFDIVRNVYNNDEMLLRHGKLMWLHRHEGDWWEFPDEVV